MRLGDLLGDVAPGLSVEDAVCPIASLASDSRTVVPGALFFAVPGSRADGAHFVSDAVARGAVAVAGENSVDLPPEVVGITVSNVRLALARAAARFHPGQPGTVVAITGTSGKTSVAAFVRQIWVRLGRSAASLGTLGLVAPGGSVYGSLTTPDPISLHATLDRLAREGVTHLALEASSHGLDQHRLDGVRFAAGAFTNLSHDHMDYHATRDAYFAAKLRLFDTLLPRGATAVVDADAADWQAVVRAAEAHGLMGFSVGHAGRDLHLQSAEPDGFTTRVTVSFRGHTFAIPLPLAGAFQVSNALVAAGLCIATGEPPAAVLDALCGLEGAPGRLDRVGVVHGAPVFVDYAHKPDALDKVLHTLRPYARRRLIVVFGCGGDRDATKRPIMGAIAARAADVTIVTDDNPRSEDPGAIRAAVLAAVPGAIEIGDRRTAIEQAVAMLHEGDVLVVAGKGHETGQIVGITVLPFSDHEVARAAIDRVNR